MRLVLEAPVLGSAILAAFEKTFVPATRGPQDAFYWQVTGHGHQLEAQAIDCAVKLHAYRSSRAVPMRYMWFATASDRHLVEDPQWRPINAISIEPVREDLEYNYVRFILHGVEEGVEAPQIDIKLRALITLILERFLGELLALPAAQAA